MWLPGWVQSNLRPLGYLQQATHTTTQIQNGWCTVKTHPPTEYPKQVGILRMRREERQICVVLPHDPNLRHRPLWAHECEVDGESGGGEGTGPGSGIEGTWGRGRRRPRRGGSSPAGVELILPFIRRGGARRRPRGGEGDAGAARSGPAGADEGAQGDRGPAWATEFDGGRRGICWRQTASFASAVGEGRLWVTYPFAQRDPNW